jgi:hypothetical protein
MIEKANVMIIFKCGEMVGGFDFCYFFLSENQNMFLKIEILV